MSYGDPSAGGQFGPPFPSGDQPETMIGDIGVSRQYVWTPAGRHPVARTSWTVVDHSRTEEKISTTGVVLAIVGLFLVCILSLLFLLMKDRTTSGFVQVTVIGDDWQYTTSIPATSPQTYAAVLAQVTWARNVSMSGGAN